MTRVYLKQHPANIADDNGIGRIVHAQWRMLPVHGIELTEDPSRADVVATHIEGVELEAVDVLHLHGLYFEDLPHDPYKNWHHIANQRIAATARRARAITVPSPWVAEVFKRDMRLSPEVVGHGIDPELWAPLPTEERRGYALWNKNRADDVCSPRPAVDLAAAGVPVVATFTTKDGRRPASLYLTGPLPFDKMREIVRNASVYLATTPETFGIGTLEAMAAGVPILGYNWAGTADLVEHGVTGFLVEPGDASGLRDGWHAILRDYKRYSDAAAAEGRRYSWDRAMRAYADLYRRIAEEKAQERHRVCVVVTSYNYGAYLDAAVDSLLRQSDPPDEILIVNDGSTDDTDDRALDLLAVHAAAGVRYHNQPNQGVAAARNNGIAATDCEYIVCLDADDQLAPDYIRVCRDALKSDRGLGIAYTGLGMWSENGVSPSPFPPAFDWEHQATPGNPPRTCVPTAAMFRRAMWERAGGYKQVFAPAEDAEFYTRGLSIGYDARKVADEPWIWYRNHPEGASKTRQYRPYDAYHPWMRDRRYPMSAPSKRPPAVLSYARPLMSVIIPVGPGHARYLPAALDSLLSQNYRQWEAIVIDDSGQPDELARALRPYPFCKVLATEGSKGPATARNLGIYEASAPLVLFLDADDWLADPDALRQLLAAQGKTGRYIYSDWVCLEDGRVWADEAPAYSQAAWFEKGQHAVTALVPTEWAREVGGFDESLTGWEDWDFFCKLAARGFCGHRQPGQLLGYRKYSGTQREASWRQREALAPQIRQRYEGVTPMGCGCGPAGEALLRIRRALTEDEVMGTELQEGQTLMEYTGGKAGTSSVQSRGKRVDGRLVRYTYGGAERLIPVWDEDVGFLESIGFRRAVPADAPAPVQTAPTVPAFNPPAAPQAAPQPRQEARAAERAPAPVGGPVAPADEVADVGEIAAKLDQGRLAAKAAEKAKAAEETVKRRPGRKPKGG
jgi:glycosyltransferase involved in cell wall biosynthesis